MSTRRYTGLVISEEGNFFDMMQDGESFRLTPTIDGQTLEEEVVQARILQVHSHPRCTALLIVLKVIESNQERLRAGTYALIFQDALVCDDIPEQPINKDVSDPEMLVDNIRERVLEFSRRNW